MIALKVVTIFLLLSVAESEIPNLGIFPIITNVMEYGVTGLCRNESKIYQKNLENGTLWAHKMLDSSAKGTFGILEGNNYQFGSYDECLNLIGPFPTQYCLISLRINAPVTNSYGSPNSDLLENPYSSFFVKLQKPNHSLMQRRDTLAIGLCLPASCSATDIQSSLRETLKENKSYQVTTNDDTCVSQSNPNKLGFGGIAFCALTIMLILLVVFGTVVDCKLKEHIHDVKPKPTWVQICLSSSLKRTWKDLFRSYETETLIFSGVRTISIIIVVIGHKGLLLSKGPWLKGEILEYVANYKFDYFLESLTVVVNTFFLMSGLFLSYVLTKEAKNKNVNWLMSILMRYLRLTPVIAYGTFYFTTMLYFTGSGPVWNQIVKPHHNACQENWWWNILYISNFINFDEICIRPLWFTSCDFQLFIFGLLMMFLIRRNEKMGYSILGLFFVISIVAPFVISLTYQLTPFVGMTDDYEGSRFLNLYYTKPYNHASSYILGMLGGICYQHLNSNKTKLSKELASLIFFICTFLTVASYGWSYHFFHYEENSTFAISLYNSLHRLIWSIGVLGICIVFSFGPYRSFLSWSIWIPLSKLSFGAYVIHMAVLLPSVAGTFVPLRPTFYSELVSIIGETVLIYVAALLLYLFVEAPTIKIFKLLLLKRQVICCADRSLNKI